MARWVLEVAQKRGGAHYQLVDIATFALPLLDEPMPPAAGQYSKPHTKAWSAAIAPLDAFVFVTPEYNHGTSGALKNALDFLYKEWNDKVAGFVAYGGTGGLRAVEHLRLVLAELQVATVRSQVGLTFRADWEAGTTFKPDPRQEKSLGAMLDQVLAWGGALKTLRAG